MTEPINIPLIMINSRLLRFTRNEVATVVQRSLYDKN